MDNADTVYQAIATLYGSDGVLSGKANVWLGEFQKSLHAWTVCDKLLHDRKDNISCYFAAQTMRTKVQCAFQELPASSHESLRDSLVQHLKNFSRGDGSHDQHVIVTQLCLALSDLYLQVLAWNGCVGELISKFGDEQGSGILLTLLKVFPEENESRNLKLGANRREEVSQDLAVQTPAVIHYLQSMAESVGSDVEALGRVFNCLGSWLSNPKVPTKELAESRLLQMLLQLLASNETPTKLHDSATDCIVQAIYLGEDIIKKHETLSQILFSGLHQMLQSFHLCVAQEDMDKLENYSRLFTELAESMLPIMVETPGVGFGSLATLDLLLNTVGHHDYALAEMTFNVWYRMSEYLYQRNREDLNEMFKPYIERLVMALYKHCRFESDFVGIPDDNEDFSEFRSKVTEVIRDVVFLIGSTKCFRQMLEILQHQGGSSWEDTEAALFIMSAVAKNIHPEEDEVVGVVVSAVVGLPGDAHACIRYTAIRMLGDLHEWVTQSASAREFVVKWLIGNFSNHKLAGVTAEALELICSDAKTYLVPVYNDLYSALTTISSASTAEVGEPAIASLLKAVSAVLSAHPAQEIGEKFKQLCAQQAIGLAQVLQWKKSGAATNGESKENAGPGREHRLSIDPVIWLDRIAAIFRQLPSSPSAELVNGKGRPWLPVVQELWPLLSETTDLYQSNTRVVEHCCRTIRFVIRSLGVESFPVIEPLVNQMVRIYQTHSHSCFLYLGSILVDEYGSFNEVGPGLLAMLQAFSVPTFALLNQERGLTNHPDTVDDLFRLCCRFVQKAPVPFFLCDTVKPLFHCATASLALDHRDAHQSVVKFFDICIDYVATMQRQNCAHEGFKAAASLLEECGEDVVKGCITGSLILSGQVLRDFAELMSALKTLSPEKFSQWLKVSLEQVSVSEDKAGVTNVQLQQYHQNFLSASDSKTMMGLLREFTRLFR